MECTCIQLKIEKKIRESIKNEVSKHFQTVYDLFGKHFLVLDNLGSSTDSRQLLMKINVISC